MTKKLSLSTGAFQCDLEMDITIIDQDKFNKEFEQVNKFWGGYDDRAKKHGGHVKAGLTLFAQECFQQMAFNNLKNKEWLTDQFDWSKQKGIEGYPSISDMGIEINDIEPWFINSENIYIKNYP
jgi:hypothetical protein